MQPAHQPLPLVDGVEQLVFLCQAQSSSAELQRLGVAPLRLVQPGEKPNRVRLTRLVPRLAGLGDRFVILRAALGQVGTALLPVGGVVHHPAVDIAQLDVQQRPVAAILDLGDVCLCAPGVFLRQTRRAVERCRRGHADAAAGGQLVVAVLVGLIDCLLVIPDCVLVVAPADEQVAEVGAYARLQRLVLQFLGDLERLKEVNVRLLGGVAVFAAGQDPEAGQVVFDQGLCAPVSRRLRLAKRLLECVLREVHLPLGLVRRGLAEQAGDIRTARSRRLAKRETQQPGQGQAGEQWVGVDCG